jgi:hypothetical protein
MMATPKINTPAAGDEHEKEPWELLPPQPPVSDAPMRWVADHVEELMEKFGGEWIAVKDFRVIDHGKDSGELGARLRQQGIKKPLIMYIGTEEDTRSGLALCCHV